jgi:glutamate-1-semialdehyde 2,1-aminomutase
VPGPQAEPMSTELLARAKRSIPGGVNTAKRRVRPPVCVRSGAGARIETHDGRSLIDYHAAYGAVLLGHAHPVVVGRVAEAIEQGVLFGVGVTPGEVELAERIVRHVPSVDEVLLCGSGSEATFHAIRLARAVTGRPKILKFQGAYHGFHDYVSRNYLGRAPFSAGMLAAAVESTLVGAFNDLGSVEAAFAQEPERIAAVIVEPIAHNAGGIAPVEGFLEGLRRICDREGALLIFDEVITGFRHDLGGYQAIAGVTPDLTTLGKALGNGFPIAAVGGRREHLERFNTSDGGDVWFAGTCNGNVPGVAAALAGIEFLEQNDVHAHLFELGDRMRAGLREVAARAGVPATVTGYGSVFALLFVEGPVRTYEDVERNDGELMVRYRRELASRGVFEIPENLGRSHLTYSHTGADVDFTLEAAERALAAALDSLAGQPGHVFLERRARGPVHSGSGLGGQGPPK